MEDSGDSDTDAPITYSMNRWSLSRSIASDCVEVIELARGRSDDADQWGMRQAADLFDGRADRRRIWPFADMVDLIAVASSEADINADSITTDDVARAVSARIEESADYEYVSEPSESESESDSSEAEDELASEAEAGSSDSESQGDGGRDASESVEDSSQETADEQPDTAESEAEPPADISPHSVDTEVDDSTGASETTLDDEPEEVTAEATTSETSETTPDREVDSDGGTGTLSAAEINAAAGSRDSRPSIGNKTVTSNAVAESSDAEGADREQNTEQGQDTDEDEYDLLESEPAETEYEPTDQAQAIAKDLYVCFVETTPDLTYRDIRAKHDTQFPNRDAAMYEAMNSRGNTRAERLADLAEWVDWWLNDEERLDRTNRFTPDPMGTQTAN
jgi:hypothetical protein